VDYFFEINQIFVLLLLV